MSIRCYYLKSLRRGEGDRLLWGEGDLAAALLGEGDLAALRAGEGDLRRGEGERLRGEADRLAVLPRLGGLSRRPR